jgi:hypothetical protein
MEKMDENNQNMGEPREDPENNEKLVERTNPSTSSQFEGKGTEKRRRESDSSGESTLTEIDDIRPPLTHTDSVPASVMSHPNPDLERGVTGPKSRTVDEEGKIIVNWESKDDPENPKNWPRRKKIFNVVIISSMTFLCPLCSSMFVR